MVSRVNIRQQIIKPNKKKRKKKGPQVHGTIDAVSDANYEKGKTFSTSTKDVQNIGVK